MVNLPNKLTKNDITNFIAGMLSIVAIKYLAYDLDIVITNLFENLGVQSKIFMAIVLSIIIYWLLKIK